MTTILPNERVAEIRARAEKATPDWELRQIHDGLPETHTHKDGTSHTFEPEYFRYIDGDQKFFPAYKINGLETLGNHECGAMEKENAEFVFHARADIPALCDSHDAQAQRIGELEESVGLKEHALELALVKNVEVLQLALRSKVESTPEGYYDALTEARSELAAAILVRDECTKANATMLDTISTLKAKLAEAEKDTARVDWLDRQKYGCFGKELFAGELAAQTQIEANGSAYKGYTLRAAIDAAIDAANETGKVSE